MNESDYGIIDDFLPQKEFREIQSTMMETSTNLTENIEWLYNSTVAAPDQPKNWKYFYMTHIIWMVGTIMSPFLYEKIIPVLRKLDAKALVRIKCNLYPNSEKIHEHDKHIDFPWPHKAAILSVNTCDGYTKLEDGTKIDSIENRMLLFNANNPHQSSTTSNTTARFNINFNYF